jgi:hypothetical protein
MKKLPLVVLTLAVACLFVCGQQAFAADSHRPNVKIRLAHRGGQGEMNEVSETAPAAQIYGVSQSFDVTSNYTIWPCFGGAAGCSDTDGGSVEVGVPEYAWLLVANTATNPDQEFGCNSTTTASAADNCGEAETFYEDFTASTSDDLVVLWEVVQGTAVIYDSGNIDFGPDALGEAVSDYPLTVVFTNAQNFGTQGVSAGPNNGNCFPSFNYPSSVNGFPGQFGITGKKTCVNAVSGLATVETTIEKESAAWILSNSATVCAPAGGPPCYTVKYTAHTPAWKETQKTIIFLQ